MNDHRPIDQVSDDVSWVRRQLAAANPVPAPGDVTTPRHDPFRVNVPSVSTHRRTKVATALVGIAAMIGGVAAAAVISSKGSRHGVTRLASRQPLLAAASTTEAARTAQVSLSVSTGTIVTTLQGAADVSTGNTDFTADLPAGIGAVEVRTIGSVAFVHLPANLQGLAGGRPWVEADVPTIEGLAGQQLGLPGFGGGLDFRGVLDWLRGVSGPVTTDGTSTVHGDVTTHYHADVDLTKAATDAPAASRAKLQQAAQAAGQTIPVDVWIDNQGRLRRLKASVDLSKLQARDGVTVNHTGTIVTTLELWNFGTPVNVTPPPADQVSPLGEISGVLKGFVGHQGILGTRPPQTPGTTLAG